MLKRTLTGLSLVALVCVCLWIGAVYSRIAIDLLIYVFAILSVVEMSRSFKNAKLYVFTVPAVLYAIGSYPIFYFFGLKGLIIELLAAVVVILTAFTFSEIAPSKNSPDYNPFDEDERSPKTKTVNDLTATVFILIYPFTFLASSFELTREYSALWVMLMAIFLPIGADTLAYFIGSTMGKRKLCPKISPKKTVAGAVGALIGGVLAALLFYFLFEYFAVIPNVGYVPMSDNKIVSAVIYVVLGLLAAVFGLIGDLAASKIKRQLGIKDYGNIFPGHGGVVDRVDSIMFTLVLLFIALPIIY